MENRVVVFILLGLVVGGVLGYGGATYSLQSKINEFSVLLEEKESEYDTLLAEYIKNSNDFLILNSSFNTLSKEYIELTRVHYTSEENRNSVMSYIRDHHPTTARFIGDIVWIGIDITPFGLVGITTYQYLGRGWNVTISWAVIANPIFEVTAKNRHEGITWTGTVYDGVVNETNYEEKPPVIEVYVQVYDEKLGYGFKHPEHWEKQILAYDSPPYDKVELLTEEGKSTRVVISVKSSNFKSLEEVKEFGYISQESILKDGFVEVNDRDAYEVTYNWPPDKKAKWVIFLANDKEYTIQCSTSEDLYAAYEEVFDNLINSFYIE
jgi:hypothetical protein